VIFLRKETSIMRTSVATAILVGALSLAPLAAFAAPVPESQATHAAKSTRASHATAGVVKTVDATSLVITRAGKAGEMTFALNPTTRREGTIEVGSHVSVRYREDGKTNVATAVMAQRAKPSAHAPKPGK
jgi:hypothetical protein